MTRRLISLLALILLRLTFIWDDLRSLPRRLPTFRFVNELSIGTLFAVSVVTAFSVFFFINQIPWWLALWIALCVLPTAALLEDKPLVVLFLPILVPVFFLLFPVCWASSRIRPHLRRINRRLKRWWQFWNPLAR